MRLLEVVRADAVSDETLASVMALAKRMRKVAVISGVCNGFIGNRMLEGYFRESAFLIEEGALTSGRGPSHDGLRHGNGTVCRE